MARSKRTSGLLGPVLARTGVARKGNAHGGSPPRGELVTGRSRRLRSRRDGETAASLRPGTLRARGRGPGPGCARGLCRPGPDELAAPGGSAVRRRLLVRPRPTVGHGRGDRLRLALAVPLAVHLAEPVPARRAAELRRQGPGGVVADPAR